jgi:hypothetical protein
VQRPSVKKVSGNSRENRKKLQHIKSLQKKAEVLHSKRLGTSAGPPKIVVRVLLMMTSPIVSLLVSKFNPRPFLYRLSLC